MAISEWPRTCEARHTVAQPLISHFTNAKIMRSNNQLKLLKEPFHDRSPAAAASQPTPWGAWGGTNGSQPAGVRPVKCQPQDPLQRCPVQAHAIQVQPLEITETLGDSPVEVFTFRALRGMCKGTSILKKISAFIMEH